MFFFLPLGVEGSRVRFPLVGLAILLLCVVAFIPTYVLEDDVSGIDHEKLTEVFEYWQERPYLELPATFEDRFLSKQGHRALEKIREKWAEDNEPVSESLQAEEQAELDGLIETALAATRDTLFHKLALTKDHGLLQVGWVTHQFLHLGWMHLIGNMLFLYAVALVLEDAWGRGWFLAFYLSGGVVAAVAEYLLHSDGAFTMVGASGAVSACIGATTVRFAARKMRTWYFVFIGFAIRTGVAGVPVWLWGALRGVSEVFDLVTGASQGVAVMAHVAGMGFGAAVALGMRFSGLDKRFVATDEVQADLSHGASKEVQAAHAAAERGDSKLAQQFFEAALKKNPSDFDAEWGLFGLDFSQQRFASASTRLEKLVLRLVKSDIVRARETLLHGIDLMGFQNVRPAFAFQALRVFEDVELPMPTQRALAERATEDVKGDVSVALLRVGQLALADGDVERARAVVEQLRARTLTEAMRVKLEALEAKLPVVVVREVALDLNERSIALNDEPVAAPAKARVRRKAVVKGFTGAQLEVELNGGEARVIEVSQVQQLGVARVGVAERVDLVVLLAFDDVGANEQHVWALSTAWSRVEALRPGVAPKDVWQAFVRALSERVADVRPEKARVQALEVEVFGALSDAEAALLGG